LIISKNSSAQNWNYSSAISSPQLNLAVIKNPIIIYGEVNPAEIGVTGPGVGQYGVQGGGIASAFAMLAAHAASVQGQRSEQLEKINAESKIFGKVISDRLNGISSDNLLKDTIEAMSNSNSILISTINAPTDTYTGFFSEYRYSVTRDYYGLFLDISFTSKDKNIPIFYITIYQNKNSPYLGKSGNYDSPYDIKKDMVVLMEEAIRIFSNREELIKRKSSSSITFKSIIGKSKRYERGSLVSEICDKHLFVSISEIWISAPKLEPNNQDVLCNTGISDLQIN